MAIGRRGRGPKTKDPCPSGRGFAFRRRAHAFPRRLVRGPWQATWLPRYPDWSGPEDTVAGQRRPLTGFAFDPCPPAARNPLREGRGDPGPGCIRLSGAIYGGAREGVKGLRVHLPAPPHVL